MNSFRKKIIGGALWSSTEVLVNQIVSVLITIILVRLLTPDDFGLAAIVMVVIQLISYVKDIGFSAAIIQKKDLKEDHRSSVFWVTLLLGLTLAIVLYCSSSLLADVFDKQSLDEFFKIISIVFIIDSFGSTHSALLRKKLAFNLIAKISITSNIMSGIIAIVLAYMGTGVWALVLRVIILRALIVIQTCFTYRWRPKLLIKFDKVRELFAFGASYSVARIYSLWVTKSDELLLGLYAESSQLGFYSNAYKIVLQPLTLVKNQTVQVLFPSLSLIQDDKDRIRNICIKTTSLLSLVGFPILLFICLMSENIVLILFGKDWLEMAPMLRLLSLAGLFEISIFPGAVLLGLGKANIYLKLMLFTNTIRFVFMLVGLYLHGTYGLIYGILFSAIINFIPYIYYSVSLIGLSVVDIVLENLKSLLIALINLFMAYVICTSIIGNLSLFFSIATFGSVYLILILISMEVFKPLGYMELRNICNSNLRKIFKKILSRKI